MRGANGSTFSVTSTSAGVRTTFLKEKTITPNRILLLLPIRFYLSSSSLLSLLLLVNWGACLLQYGWGPFLFLLLSLTYGHKGHDVPSLCSILHKSTVRKATSGLQNHFVLGFRD